MIHERVRVQRVRAALSPPGNARDDIGIIACRNGLGTTGGADGVGRATTATVVVASITVLVSDFFLTKLFLLT